MHVPVMSYAKLSIKIMYCKLTHSRELLLYYYGVSNLDVSPGTVGPVLLHDGFMGLFGLGW